MHIFMVNEAFVAFIHPILKWILMTMLRVSSFWLVPIASLSSSYHNDRTSVLILPNVTAWWINAGWDTPMLGGTRYEVSLHDPLCYCFFDLLRSIELMSVLFAHVDLFSYPILHVEAFRIKINTRMCIRRKVIFSVIQDAEYKFIYELTQRVYNKKKNVTVWPS